MRNYDLLEDYFQKFGEPIPLLYMMHLEDEEFNALVAKALADGVPIDTELLCKDLPEGAVI